MQEGLNSEVGWASALERMGLDGRAMVLAVGTPAQATSLCSEQELAVPVGPNEESLIFPSYMPCHRVEESETLWASPSICGLPGQYSILP